MKKHIKILTLSLLFFGGSVFAEGTTPIRLKQGIWYYAFVDDNGYYHPMCLVGYPNNYPDNKTRSTKGFGKRKILDLSSSEIKICKQYIACNKDVSSRECSG